MSIAFFQKLASRANVRSTNQDSEILAIRSQVTLKHAETTVIHTISTLKSDKYLIYPNVKQIRFFFNQSHMRDSAYVVPF